MALKRNVFPSLSSPPWDPLDLTILVRTWTCSLGVLVGVGLGDGGGCDLTGLNVAHTYPPPPTPTYHFYLFLLLLSLSNVLPTTISFAAFSERLCDEEEMKLCFSPRETRKRSGERCLSNTEYSFYHESLSSKCLSLISYVCIRFPLSFPLVSNQRILANNDPTREKIRYTVRSY